MLNAYIEKNWLQVILDKKLYEINEDFSLNGINVDGQEETIYVNVVYEELTFMEEIEKALKDREISFTKATTGSIYIKLNFDENFEYKEIRISDHDANVPNKRRSNKYEIDPMLITDVYEFVEDVRTCLEWKNIEEIEKYKYEP